MFWYGNGVKKCMALTPGASGEMQWGHKLVNNIHTVDNDAHAGEFGKFSG